MQLRYKKNQTNSRRGQNGIAMVEMALFMTIFVFMLIGLMDFGKIMNASVELSNGLRAGLSIALSQPNNSSGITYAVQHGSTLPSANVTSTNSTFCECDGSSIACNGVCGGTMATFITVNAGYSVPLLLTYPTLGNSFSLSKSVSIRVQ